MSWLTGQWLNGQYRVKTVFECMVWLLFMMFSCVFVTFPSGNLSQMWNLIVSILDLCQLSYYDDK